MYFRNLHTFLCEWLVHLDSHSFTGEYELEIDISFMQLELQHEAPITFDI